MVLQRRVAAQVVEVADVDVGHVEQKRARDAESPRGGEFFGRVLGLVGLEADVRLSVVEDEALDG